MEAVDNYCACTLSQGGKLGEVAVVGGAVCATDAAHAQIGADQNGPLLADL